MAHYRLAFVGFGNVGKALAQLLLKKRDELIALYDIAFSVTGIATNRHGYAVNLDGIDLEKAIISSDLSPLGSKAPPVNIKDFILSSEADVLFENTPVNYQSGQPAIDHLRVALSNGMHGITANKGPVVYGYHELTEIAKQNNCKFFFESTVMDGAPVFSLFRESIPCANIHRIMGVLNSTTNTILSRMELGDGFDQAVEYCQEIGIAETDPSGDVDGWDAAIKIAALIIIYMNSPMTPHEVDRNGIRSITMDQIEAAKKIGKRWKLVCTASRNNSGIVAEVSPQMVGPESPLFTVDGTTSIVQIESDVLGKLSLIEQDPGPHTTAYGLFADFINAVK